MCQWLKACHLQQCVTLHNSGTLDDQDSHIHTYADLTLQIVLKYGSLTLAVSFTTSTYACSSYKRWWKSMDQGEDSCANLHRYTNANLLSQLLCSVG